MLTNTVSREAVARTAHLSVRAAAAEVGCNKDTITRVRKELGITPSSSFPPRYIPSHAAKARHHEAEIADGVVLIGSDAHYWPEDKTPTPTAHRAFVHMCTELRPFAVILNGDIVDGARVSRWDAMHWAEYTDRPTVADEIGACQRRLREIAEAAPGAARYWTLGNHDSRFERYLIAQAPEAIGVHGTRLKDHFDEWTPAMSVWLNSGTENACVVKHRFKSGVHAAHNNTVTSGVSMVTGHLHSLKVTPYSDYRGTRYGVDCGMLGSPYGMQDLYAEDNPVNWRSGFAVLTFVGGVLLPPETVQVIDEERGLVAWRGSVLEV